MNINKVYLEQEPWELELLRSALRQVTKWY